MMQASDKTIYKNSGEKSIPQEQPNQKYRMKTAPGFVESVYER